MLYSWSPSSISSFTPVTVTPCATFQFAGVNATDGTEIVPSPGLLLERPIVTFASGWLVSTSVKFAVPPASVVTSPLVGETLIDAVSLSRFVSATSAGSRPLYFGSVLVAGALTALYALSPSSTASSTPVTVIVCGTFQSLFLNVSVVAGMVPSDVLLDVTTTCTCPV